jgi:uncharacterized protein YcsI (UPF0317 family)
MKPPDPPPAERLDVPPQSDLADPAQVRRGIRAGTFTAFTNTVAPGYVQGNLVILPERHADGFENFCRRNPRPCPLIGVSRPGSPRIPELAEDMDLRTDVGEYRIFRDGAASTTATGIADLWRGDFVAFVLGCSFSFEHALRIAGVALRHIEEGNVSAMYVTGIDTESSGDFRGKLVVSMRPLRSADAKRAVAVTSRFPSFHGPPIHIGKPDEIGVDLQRPYGGHGLTTLRDDEIPVFWACGATAQVAIEMARLPLAITHSRAHMVVTDRRIDEFEYSNPRDRDCGDHSTFGD